MRPLPLRCRPGPILQFPDRPAALRHHRPKPSGRDYAKSIRIRTEPDGYPSTTTTRSGWTSPTPARSPGANADSCCPDIRACGWHWAIGAGWLNDAVDIGAIWDSGTGPDSRPGDWWLSLPVGVDESARARAAESDTPVPWSGPVSHDLIDADGNRVIELGSLVVRVGRKTLGSAGTRPEPAEGTITVEHTAGGCVDRDETGRLDRHQGQVDHVRRDEQYHYESQQGRRPSGHDHGCAVSAPCHSS